MGEIYYDYLQSEPRAKASIFARLGTAFEDVMKLPIESLKLTGTAKELFVDKPFLHNQKPIRLFTVGDLVNFGLRGVEQRLASSGARNQKVVLYNIELALAKFALKLKGDNFDVFEIDVEDMGLSDEAAEWCVKNGMSSLGDVYAHSINKSHSITESRQKRRIMTSVRSSLLKFGVVLKNKMVSLGKEDEQVVLEMFPSIKAELKLAAAPAEPKLDMSILNDASYENTPCDYSKLLSLIRLHYRDLDSFIKDADISEQILEKIVSGRELKPSTIQKLCRCFNMPVGELVEYKTDKIPTNRLVKNVGLGDTYDFSKAFLKIRSIYGGRQQFVEASGVSMGVVTRMAKGIMPGPQNMRKICKALRCTPEDIMEVLDPEKAASGEENSLFYDYAKLKAKLKAKHISIIKLLAASDIEKKEYCRFKITRNIPMSDEELASLAKVLECEASDLYEETKQNPNVQCDYSKLLALLKAKMLSMHEISAKLNITNLAKVVKYNMHLAKRQLEKLCAYLGCQPSDIVTELKTREETEELHRKARLRKAREVDYSKLFEKLKQAGLTIEQLAQIPGMGKSFATQVRRGQPLLVRDRNMLMNYFGCKEDDLCTWLVPKPKRKPNKKTDMVRDEDWTCDYGKLLKLVPTVASSLSQFVLDAKLPAYCVGDIRSGRMLSVKMFVRLMEAANKPLDELVTFREPEDRERMMAAIDAESQKMAKRQAAADVDWSGLHEKLKERGMTPYDLVVNKVVSANTLSTALNAGKSVRSDTMMKLCTYFGCKPEELCKRTRKASRRHFVVNPNAKWDYSILLNLVDNGLIELTAICREVGVPVAYANLIRRGESVAYKHMEKLCGYFGFKPEEIIFKVGSPTEAKAADAQGEETEEDEDMLIAAVAAQEAADMAEEEEKTAPGASEASQPSGQGGRKGSTPRGTKFYANERGYTRNRFARARRWAQRAEVEQDL